MDKSDDQCVLSSSAARHRTRPAHSCDQPALFEFGTGFLPHQQNGQAIEVNTIELLLISMRNLAMSGDLRAAKWLTDHRAKIAPDPGEGGGYLVVPEGSPPDKFIEREMFLNKFRTNPELKEDPALYNPNARYNRDL